MQITLAFWNLRQLAAENGADASKHVAYFAAHHDAAFVIEPRTDGCRLQKDMLAGIHQTAQSQYGVRIESGMLGAGKEGAGEHPLFCFVRSNKPASADSLYEVHLQKLSCLNAGKGGSIIATLAVWDKSTSKVREVKLAIPSGTVPGTAADVDAALAKEHVIVAGERYRNYSQYEIANVGTDSNGQSVLTINL